MDRALSLCCAEHHRFDPVLSTIFHQYHLLCTVWVCSLIVFIVKYPLNTCRSRNQAGHLFKNYIVPTYFTVLIANAVFKIGNMFLYRYHLVNVTKILLFRNHSRWKGCSVKCVCFVYTVLLIYYLDVFTTIRRNHFFIDTILVYSSIVLTASQWSLIS